MELYELIEAVKAAKNKNELEDLVKRELGIDLDKRKSLAVLRQSVLSGLGVEAAAGAGEPDPENDAAEAVKENAQAPDETEQTEQGAEDAAEMPGDGAVKPDEDAVAGDAETGTEDQSDLMLPEIAEDSDEEAPAPSLRLLRNTKTGREFVWTPALAKLADLVEV